MATLPSTTFTPPTMNSNTPAFSFIARPPPLNALDKNYNYNYSSSSSSIVRRRPRPLRHSVVTCTANSDPNNALSFPTQLVSQALSFLRTWPPRPSPDTTTTTTTTTQSATIDGIALVNEENPTVTDLDVSRMVAAELRELNANSAADLAFALVMGARKSIPDTWKETLDVLREMGITGDYLDGLINRFGLFKLLTIQPDDARNTVELLTSNLYLSPTKLRRLILRNPSLLLEENHDTVASNVQFLCGMRFNHHRDLQDIAARSPDILLGNTHNMKRVLHTLQTEAQIRGCIKNLIVRAPGILLYQLEDTVVPVLEWLKRENFDVDKFVRSCPYILGSSVQSFEVVKSFLTDHVQATNYHPVIKSFPPILIAPVQQLEAAVYFLRVELGIPLCDVSKIVQAFPTTLVLDVDAEMRVNVEYFRGKGIENICRIVKRLPPILSYDLAGNIIPKMNYLENTLGLSPYDLLSFPAYFSYNLKHRIQPRTLFLLANGKSVAEIGLNLAITCTDRQFCERIAKLPLDDYNEFVLWLEQKRNGKLSSRRNGNSNRNSNRNSRQGNRIRSCNETRPSKRPVIRPRIIREVKEEKKVLGS